MLEDIRLILKLEISHLSIFLGMPKKDVYELTKKGYLPESDSHRKISSLAQIAKTFKNAGIKRADNLLKMKAFEGGKSLTDIVEAGEDWSEPVKILIEEYLAMENAYNRSGLYASKAKPTKDWQTYLSIPNSTEDL